jgi:hypothetical protein
MAAAGARVVVASSPDRVTTWEADGEASLETLIDGTGGMGAACDVVIVEGFKSSDLPKIVVCRDDDETISEMHVDNVVGEVRFSRDEPIVVLPETVTRFADLIEQPLQPDAGENDTPLTLSVNNEEIPLKPYLSMMLFRLVTSLLSVLKGIPEDPDTVALTITKAGERKPPE